MLVNCSTDKSVKSRSFPAVLFRTKGVLILSPLTARAADLASAKLRGGALVTVGGAGGSEQVDVDGTGGTASRGAGRGRYSPWEFIAARVSRVLVRWSCYGSVGAVPHQDDDEPLFNIEIRHLYSACNPAFVSLIPWRGKMWFSSITRGTWPLVGHGPYREVAAVRPSRRESPSGATRSRGRFRRYGTSCDEQRRSISRRRRLYAERGEHQSTPAQRATDSQFALYHDRSALEASVRQVGSLD